MNEVYIVVQTYAEPERVIRGVFQRLEAAELMVQELSAQYGAFPPASVEGWEVLDREVDRFRLDPKDMLSIEMLGEP